MKRLTNIKSKLDKSYSSQSPVTSLPKPNIENASIDSIKNILDIQKDLNVSIEKTMPEISGTVGKIVFNSLKSNDSEQNLVEIINDSTGNKFYIMIHPSGSFELYNNDGDHILKSVNDNIIVGKNITIESAEQVIIKANDNTELLDEIVTVSKLRSYLEGVTDSFGTPIFNISLPLPITTADIGTENIKVGKGS